LKDKKLRKELIRLLCAEGQPTKAVLARTCIGVFLIRFMKHFFNAFLPKPPADHLANHCGSPMASGPQFEKHWTKLSRLSD
jgi:hypothetical protein